MKLLLFAFVSSMLLIACETPKDPITAEFLLDKSIEASGGADFFHTSITFNIGDLEYVMNRDGLKTDFSLKRVIDTLTYFSTYKGGLVTYYENGVEIAESMQSRKYLDARLDGFLFLTSIPHVFKENAVIAEREEDVTITGKKYHSVRITYKHQQDIEDINERNVFYIYINPETYLVDYTAFRFDLYQGFPNFQRRFNHRKENGIVFADYYSFYPIDQSVPTEDLYKAYNKREVREGPLMEYSDITVEINPYE